LKEVFELEIEEVLNIARSFVLLQLNGDVNTMKFLSANYQTGYWIVKCYFKDKQTTTYFNAAITIHDNTKKVESFNTQIIG